MSSSGFHFVDDNFQAWLDSLPRGRVRASELDQGYEQRTIGPRILDLSPYPTLDEHGIIPAHLQ